MNLACAQIWDAKGGNEFEKTDRDILLDLEGIEDVSPTKSYRQSGS